MLEILEACGSDKPVRDVPEGETLISEGTRCGVLYILVEGEVEILKGDFQVAMVSEPGAVFGEVSVLLHSPHTATVKTTAPSRFLVIDDPASFLISEPEVALGISTLLAERLHLMTTYLVDLKNQYEGSDDHFSMVDEVLETLSHTQRAGHTPGSDRDPDPTVS